MISTKLKLLLFLFYLPVTVFSVHLPTELIDAITTRISDRNTLVNAKTAFHKIAGLHQYITALRTECQFNSFPEIWTIGDNFRFSDRCCEAIKMTAFYFKEIQFIDPSVALKLSKCIPKPWPGESLHYPKTVVLMDRSDDQFVDENPQSMPHLKNITQNYPWLMQSLKIEGSILWDQTTMLTNMMTALGSDINSTHFQLQELEITRSNVQDYKILAPLAPHLKSFSLKAMEGNRVDLFTNLVEFISSCSNLESLTLRDCLINDQMMSESNILSALHSLENLRHVDLGGRENTFGWFYREQLRWLKQSRGIKSFEGDRLEKYNTVNDIIYDVIRYFFLEENHQK